MDNEQGSLAVVMRVWIDDEGGWYLVVVERDRLGWFAAVIYAYHAATQQWRAVGIRVDNRVDALDAVLWALGKLRLSLQHLIGYAI